MNATTYLTERGFEFSPDCAWKEDRDRRLFIAISQDDRNVPERERTYESAPETTDGPCMVTIYLDTTRAELEELNCAQSVEIRDVWLNVAVHIADNFNHHRKVTRHQTRFATIADCLGL